MNTRQLFWQLPLLILLTAPLWHGPMARFLTLDKGSVAAEAMPRQGSSFSMEDIAFRQTKQGAADILVQARRLRGSAGSAGYDLDTVEARQLGPKPIQVTSGNAHYDPDRQILTLMDNVVLQTADLVVKTVVMRYLTKFDTIKSAAEVEMTGNGFDITGTSFMYNLATRNLRIGKRVHFQYTPPAGTDTKTAR